MLLPHLSRPLPEVIHRSLECLVEALDVRASFVGRIDDGALEIVDAISADGPAIEIGLRMPLDDTFTGYGEDGLPVNVRDAAKREPFKDLGMRHLLRVTSYLGVPVSLADGTPYGTLAVLGKGARAFSERDVDLLLVVSGLISPRLDADGGAESADPAGARTPVSAVRLASHEVQEPLAIMRGYADMLSHNEVPAEEMPLVARRLAMQSETVIRIVDQVLLMSRLPLKLAFTVRVSLVAVAHASADRVRQRMEQAGMELRLQLDVQGEVWGDAALLEAALDEMLQNVFAHAQSATVVQLRLRQGSADRFHFVVKDDGPGISAERLAELFGPMPSANQQPARGQGLGLYLLRRVAQAHGGRAWANSLEGKGTTFYLELPAASPDGDTARISASAVQAPA
jgi:signal transduction histidine kinase